MQIFLTIWLCAAHPLHLEKTLCEVRYSQPFETDALCERAADLDGDGQADQLWVDLEARLAQPGQWLEIRCPLRGYSTK